MSAELGLRDSDDMTVTSLPRSHINTPVKDAGATRGGGS